MDNRNYYKMFLEDNNSNITNNGNLQNISSKKLNETSVNMSNQQMQPNISSNQAQNQLTLTDLNNNSVNNLSNNYSNNQNLINQTIPSNTISNSNVINNTDSNNTNYVLDQNASVHPPVNEIKNKLEFQSNELNSVYNGIKPGMDIYQISKLRDLVNNYKNNVEINKSYRVHVTILNVIGSLGFISLFFGWSAINMRKMSGNGSGIKFWQLFCFGYIPFEISRKWILNAIYQKSFDERYKGMTIKEIKNDISSMKKEKVRFV